MNFFLIILFLSTTLSTGMIGISLHMQWSLTSQSHGSILKEINCFFLLRIKQTPCPYPTRSLPAFLVRTLFYFHFLDSIKNGHSDRLILNEHEVAWEHGEVQVNETSTMLECWSAGLLLHKSQVAVEADCRWQIEDVDGFCDKFYLTSSRQHFRVIKSLIPSFKCIIVLEVCLPMQSVFGPIWKTFFFSITFLKYTQWHCMLSFDNSTAMY
jgi:hypothetical protein